MVLLKILKKGETGNGNATKTKGASVFSRKLEHPNTADIKQFNTQDIEKNYTKKPLFKVAPDPHSHSRHEVTKQKKSHKISNITKTKSKTQNPEN